MRGGEVRYLTNKANGVEQSFVSFQELLSQLFLNEIVMAGFDIRGKVCHMSQRGRVQVIVQLQDHRRERKREMASG